MIQKIPGCWSTNRKGKYNLINTTVQSSALPVVMANESLLLAETRNRSLDGRSRRYREISKMVDRLVEFEPSEAIELIKKTATAKFEETIEVHARLNLNSKYSDQQLRATVNLPNGTGETVRVAVITRSEAAEAISAGADVVGSDDLIERIAAGFLEFDKLLTTPDMMPMIAKLGRLLGPKGLMPNAKTGSVTTLLGPAITEFKGGKIDFRTDKTGIVHFRIGKAGFEKKILFRI